MMSLFDKQHNDQVIARIYKLNHSAPPQWGSMNSSQMLAHCQVLFKIAYDEIETKKSFLGLLFGKMAKKSVLNDKPFAKDLPTIKEARIKTTRDFHTERDLLIGYVSRMATGPDAITQKIHPFFGQLTIPEWDLLQYKHIDHHLKQFGV